MPAGRTRRPRHDPQARSGWLIGSAVLLGVVPVLGLYLLLTRPTAAHAPRQHLPAPALTSSAATVGRGCNIPGDGSTTALGSVPADLTWVVSNGDLAPTSPTAGPMTTDGGVARCFAHDPEGALIASVRIQQQIVGATPSTWPAAAEGLAPGPDSDALTTQMATLLAQPPAPADTNTPFAAVAGFKFLSYSPTTAVIELVYRTTSAVLYAASQTMQWVGGDWRIAPLGPSELSSPQTAVGSLLGYVEWRQP